MLVLLGPILVFIVVGPHVVMSKLGRALGP